MLTELKLTEVPDTGASILLDHAGAGVARTASGRFLRLQSPPPRLVGTLAGTDEGTTQSREHAADLSAELQAREAADAQIRWPARRRQVVLIGTGEVPDDVAAACSSGRSASLATAMPMSSTPPGTRGATS